MKEKMSIEKIEAELARLLKKRGNPYKDPYWGPDGILSFAPRIEALKKRLGQTADATIGAASTYYSAWGHAMVKVLSIKNPLRPMFWVWAWRTLATFSKAFIRTKRFLRFVKAGFVPSLNDWDVVGSIYSVIPFGPARRLAIRYFTEGLKIAEAMDASGKSSGLLLVKIGRTHGANGNDAEAEPFIERALATVTEETDPKTSNRIKRDAGDFFCSKKSNEGGADFVRGVNLLSDALDIALKAGLTDSVLKIKGVIRKRVKDFHFEDE